MANPEAQPFVAGGRGGRGRGAAPAANFNEQQQPAMPQPAMPQQQQQHYVVPVQQHHHHHHHHHGHYVAVQPHMHHHHQARGGFAGAHHQQHQAMHQPPQFVAPAPATPQMQMQMQQQPPSFGASQQQQPSNYNNTGAPASPSGGAAAPAPAAAPMTATGGTFKFNVDATPYVREELPDSELFKDHSAGIDFSKYESIEISVVPGDIPAATNFASMNLHPLLVANVQRCNYANPTPVQRSSIPVVMAGHDLMTSAQTGSGKTCAYLLPAINYVLNNSLRPMPCRVATPTALVLAPTRELGVQIYDEGRKFTFSTGLRCVVVYGGSEARHQISELQRGCNLVVATPGRLGDIYKRGVISYSQIQFLVLDEADRMLDMGFEPQIREIVEQSDMPPTGQRQTLMYSATFPREMQQLARSFLSPGFYFCQVGRVGSTTDAITQSILWVEPEDKLGRMIQVLNDFRDQLVLVFIEKKRDCDYLERQLYQWGFPVCAIHGDRPQRDREMALAMFKSGSRKILLATDVAARGLDIPNVSLVLQHDLPTNIDDYVHRIGRTGRAGNKGQAFAFFNETNRMINDDMYDLLVESKQTLPEFLTEPKRRGVFHHNPHGYRGRGGPMIGAGGGGRGRGGGHHHHHHHQHLHQGHLGGFQPHGHHHGYQGHQHHHHNGFGSGYQHHNNPAPHSHHHHHAPRGGAAPAAGGMMFGGRGRGM